MMIKYINRYIITLGSMLLMVAIIISACKKYENPPQIFEEYGDNMQGKAERKVLIINIDGAVGAELKKISPENIAAMVKQGKYTFNQDTDIVSSDAGTLASMLTGVTSVKHGIVDDSYMQAVNNDGDEHGAVNSYPTMFSRLLDIKPEFQTVTITTDPSLSKYLIHADHRILTANDAAVKDSAVNVLQNNNSKVLLVDFRAVKDAGISSEFSADAPAYRTAIENVDGYIGELMEALKNRKNYQSEDWLVIVTTNRGGDEANPQPGFIICSNPNLQEEEVMKVGFNTMHFTGTSTTAVIKNDNGLYDPGTDKDFTVQVQIKFNIDARWPGFLSKSTDVDGHTNTGWTMVTNGDTWEVVFGGKMHGGQSHYVRAPAISIGQWHTLTFTVKTTGGTRTAALYTDGEFSIGQDITNVKNLSSSEPLKLGYRRQDAGTNELDFYAADIQYFNKALDATTIKNNIALKDITQHPDYSSLIGFWPVDEGGGAQILNRAPVGYNFLMTGSGTWNALGNDIPVSKTPETISDGAVSVVSTGSDIAALTFYWLRIPVKSEWGLDGVPWISNFELEFIK